ncbi:unnamed protein product [Ilex paraguariensis]|uniref:Magnesium transporter n=1 Tax=Ilex paraguariensis TaxID=185542 RepID=A0ABC8S7Z0_9AQUA
MKAAKGKHKAMEESPSDMLLQARDSSPKTPLELPNMGTSKPLPFEFRALEICLDSVCKNLESETSTLEKEAYPALDQLSAKTSSRSLQHVRLIKGRLVALSGRVQKVRDELEHLLDDDADMSEMYLTKKLARLESDRFLLNVEQKDANESELHDMSDANDGSSIAPIRGHKPNIEELELLLGAYFMQMEEILNKLLRLREYVHDTDDYINIILDEKQNELLQLSVIINTVTMMLNIGILIFGIFGMNIVIDLFNIKTYAQWYAASAGVVGGISILFIITILWLKTKGLLG